MGQYKKIAIFNAILFFLIVYGVSEFLIFAALKYEALKSIISVFIGVVVALNYLIRYGRKSGRD